MTVSKSKAKSNYKSIVQDAYDKVTEAIIQKLESGVVPWRKTWKAGQLAPKNLVSGKVYRGMNLIMLGCSEFKSPYWATFNQVRDLGGCVKRGEKGMPVVFWKLFEVEGKEGTQGESTEKKIPFLKYSIVFNVEQCEGLNVPVVEDSTENEFNPIEEAEKIWEGYKERPELIHGGAVAAFGPSSDLIKMPNKECFEAEEAYYATLFHEMVHSTGHKARLDRFEAGRFGSHAYSKEELVAEMGAAILSSECGILANTIDNSASYIENWLLALRNDRKLLVQASAQAAKAVDYILNRIHE